MKIASYYYVEKEVEYIEKLLEAEIEFILSCNRSVSDDKISFFTVLENIFSLHLLWYTGLIKGDPMKILGKFSLSDIKRLILIPLDTIVNPFII